MISLFRVREARIFVARPLSLSKISIAQDAWGKGSVLVNSKCTSMIAVWKVVMSRSIRHHSRYKLNHVWLLFSLIFYLVSWWCCFWDRFLSGAVMGSNWYAGKSHSNFDSLLEPDLPEIRDHRSFSSRHLSEEEQSDRIEKLESYVEQLEEEITALRKLKEELVEVKARSSFSSLCIHFYMRVFLN